MHGKQSCSCERQAYIASQFVEQSKHNKDDDHVEREVHCMEGPSIKSENFSSYPVRHHLQRSIIIALFSYAYPREAPKVCPKQLQQRGARAQAGIHNDLLMVVPDKSITDGIAIRGDGQDTQERGCDRRSHSCRWSNGKPIPPGNSTWGRSQLRI